MHRSDVSGPPADTGKGVPWLLHHGVSGYAIDTFIEVSVAGPSTQATPYWRSDRTNRADTTMGLFGNEDDDSTDSEDNGSDKGTYIQFISGPDHRDWKESWSPEAASDIADAYDTAAPSGSSGVVNKFAKAGWEDRDHFYAVVTLAFDDAFAEQDFTTLLDLAMGVTGEEDDEVLDMYADNLVQYLRDNPEVAERVMEQANSEPAPADD